MNNSKTQKQLALLRESTMAVVRYLDNTSIALIIKNKDVGSGTCIKIGSRYFIATAAHNLIGCTSGDVLLVHSKTPSSHKINITKFGFIGGGKDDLLDVGFIELSEDEVNKSGKRFIEFTQLEFGVHHKDDDLILVSGYPSEIVQILASGNAVTPIGYGTISCRVGTNSFSAYDIFLEYPEENNAIYDKVLHNLPKAHGLSGGGFWSLHINDSGLWSTDKIKLIGLDVSWSERNRWVKGIQIQHWLDLVLNEYPDLRPNVPLLSRLKTSFLCSKIFIYFSYLCDFSVRYLSKKRRWPNNERL